MAHWLAIIVNPMLMLKVQAQKPNIHTITIIIIITKIHYINIRRNNVIYYLSLVQRLKQNV